jgi:NAD(P)-dependent dehydrogenase (short-subunit alcohol dehydrogenase family)
MTDPAIGRSPAEARTAGGGVVLDGAGIVITGAGSGIGAALANRFAAEGSRLVLADRNADAVLEVADRLGAVAVPGDVTEPDDVQHLVETAIGTLGGIDVFCANAGIAPASSLDPAAWEAGWQVNVLSHLHAARALLPGWLAAGRGRLLITVSAAGLLTMLGNAAYAVTKHAALAFAEWLQVTYAHRGITVQALCPQGVRTPMLAATGPRGEMLMGEGAIDPSAVAESVVQALGTDRFLILPHPEVADFVVKRAGDLDRWLASMNRIQRRMELVAPGDEW